MCSDIYVVLICPDSAVRKAKPSQTLQIHQLRFCSRANIAKLLYGFLWSYRQSFCPLVKITSTHCSFGILLPLWTDDQLVPWLILSPHNVSLLKHWLTCCSLSISFHKYEFWEVKSRERECWLIYIFAISHWLAWRNAGQLKQILNTHLAAAICLNDETKNID